MSADLHALAARIEKLSVQDRLRLAADLIDNKAADAALVIARRAADDLFGHVRLGAPLKTKTDA